MKTKKLLYILFFIVLLSVYMNLAWDAAGRISPIYYNMIMGAIFTGFALLHGNTYIGEEYDRPCCADIYYILHYGI